MVLTHRFPPDIRVEKEAKSLIEAGYSVSIATLVKPDENASPYIYEGTKVFPTRINRVLPYRGWRYFSLASRLVDPFFLKHIRNIIEREKPDAIHIHDLPMFRTAYLAGSHHSCKFVLDLHENYPAALAEYKKSQKGIRKLLNCIWTGRRKWNKYELWAVRKANRVIVVVDEAKERFLGKGIDEDKFVIVSNTASRSLLDLPLDKDLIQMLREKGEYTILYLGGFGAHRGLETAIRATKIASAKVDGLHLFLVGAQKNIKSYTEKLLNLRAELGIEDKVEILQWQDFKKVKSFILAADLCIVPHSRNDHTDTTVPHKLFQYMLLGRPVLVSDTPPLKRIVESSGGGLVFKGDDPVDMADKIVKLYIEGGKEYGKKAQETALKNYLWEEIDSAALVNLYKELTRCQVASNKEQEQGDRG